MQLERALSGILEIRAQLHRTESYRGFRSQTICLSGLIAFIGGFVQPFFVARPVEQFSQYLMLWTLVAAVSALLATVEMCVRALRRGDSVTWRMHQRLALALLPAICVGAVVTAYIWVQAASASNAIQSRSMLVMLPACWSMIYSLGLFNCTRLLHRSTVWVAWYFLLVGGALLISAWFGSQLAAWQMVVSFGIGQWLFGILLFLNTERFRD